MLSGSEVLAKKEVSRVGYRGKKLLGSYVGAKRQSLESRGSTEKETRTNE